MLGSRRTIAAVAAGFVLTLGSCGGTDFARRPGAPNPAVEAPPTSVAVTRDPALQATLARAAALTAAARSARTSISVTVTGDGNDALATGAYNLAGTGVVDFATGDADLVLSSPQFDRFAGGGAIEQRIVGGGVYAKLPPDFLRAAGAPAAVRWVSLDPERAGSGSPAGPGAHADPEGQLVFLAAASDDVRRVGPESVRGVRSTHFRATIDPSGAARRGSPTAAARVKLAQLGSTLGTRRLVVDVWLDSSGRARRVVVSVPLAPSGSGLLDGLGPDVTMRIQADFYGFGQKVRVTAPPRAEVRPYSALRARAP
ncbi:MAG TPA: hypothetical protein VIK54_04955 [Acidimicrobiia bacterium]